MKRLAVLFLVALLLLPGLAQAKIFLEDTNDTLRVVTASGVTTIHMYASWADITTTAITPGSSTARVTTATTTALVASPAASTQRQIKGLSVYNAHASSSNAITVEFFDGTNATTLVKYTLLAGETLQWGEDDNFNVIDASGQIKGLVAATQSGTWTVQPGNTANTTPWLATINQGGNSAVVTTTTPGASDAGVVVRNINSSAAADNSTNSTAKSPVLPCTANASAPSWAEGRQVPCSTDLSGNERVNVANINGVAPLMGAGNTGTGSPRVTIATDQAALNGLGVYAEDAGETAGGNLSMAGTVRRDTAASSAGTTGNNATLNTDANGLLWTRTIDPCSSTAKTFLAINISTATTTEITPSLAGASTNYYVCSLVLVTAAANNIALVDADSDGCGSVTSGLAGGTSAASGFNMAANSGMTFGNGMGSVFKTAGTNRVLCLVTSAATQLSGTMAVVAAP